MTNYRRTLLHQHNRWRVITRQKLRRRVREARLDREVARVLARRRRPSVYTSEPLSLMAGIDYRPMGKRGRLEQHQFVAPSCFSVIDNPEESLAVITRLARRFRSGRYVEVTYWHKQLREMDVAAEEILDLMATEYSRERVSRRLGKPAAKGHLPDDQLLQRKLRAIGIIKRLNVSHEFLSWKKERELQEFAERSYPQARKIRVVDHKSRVVQDFVFHINNCLGSVGRTLTRDAGKKLADYTGEILANAEEHAGMNEWFIYGYLDNETHGRICEIAIFNFGKTIADTLREVPLESLVRREIDPYIDAHRSRRLFRPGWNEDDLLTLIALQQYVTSKPIPGENRGLGTVELIHFFQRMHKECAGLGEKAARMAILSGSTHILFDGRYMMHADADGRQVIAFNSGNDLRTPPDPGAVRHLNSVHFPGTVISIRFPLQASQTQAASRGQLQGSPL